jgi:hypothetical protein
MKAIFVEVMFHIMDDLDDLSDQISPLTIIQKKAFSLTRQRH